MSDLFFQIPVPLKKKSRLSVFFDTVSEGGGIKKSTFLKFFKLKKI